MRKWSNLAIDACVALGWGVVVASYRDIQAVGEWTVVIGVTLLAGALSGRYRILVMAVVAAILVATLSPFGSPCDDTACEDDLPLVSKVLLFALLAAIPALVMAFGVFLRQSFVRNRESSYSPSN